MPCKVLQHCPVKWQNGDLSGTGYSLSWALSDNEWIGLVRLRAGERSGRTAQWARRGNSHRPTLLIDSRGNSNFTSFQRGLFSSNSTSRHCLSLMCVLVYVYVSPGVKYNHIIFSHTAVVESMFLCTVCSVYVCMYVSLSTPSDPNRYSPDESGEFSAPAECHRGKRQDGGRRRHKIIRLLPAACHSVPCVYLTVCLACLSDLVWWLARVSDWNWRVGTNYTPASLLLVLVPNSSQSRIIFVYLTLWSLQPIFCVIMAGHQMFFFFFIQKLL